MNRLTKDLDQQIVSFCVDDLLLHGPEFSKVLATLRKLFQEVRETRIHLAISKAKLFYRKLTEFGFEITPDGIWVSKKIHNAIINFQSPRDIKSLHKFIGLCNFCRQQTPRLAKLLAPLLPLIKKRMKYKWQQEQERCFINIKRILADSISLVRYDTSAPIRFNSDAAHDDLGGAIFQHDS